MEPARVDVRDVPFWERSVTLGCVRGGAITYTHRRADKAQALESAIAELEAGTVYFVAWTGRWFCDVFTVTLADVVRWLGERT